MKWYSAKKHIPSLEGHYLVRWLDAEDFVGMSIVLWNGKVWRDYDQKDHLFKEKITHFCMPDPVEIEE